MKSLRSSKEKKNNSPCVWMQAGVVRSKYCKAFYDCANCQFDRTMTNMAEENSGVTEHADTKGKNGKKIVYWMEKLKELPSSKRPCIHYMKGRIDFRSCSHDYKCINCEFDQYFSDQYTVHATVNPVEVLNVHGFRIPQGYYLHKGHAWVKIEEGKTVRIGLDDFALKVFGPLEHIEAPLIGKQMKQNSSQIIIKRGNLTASLLSPVSGVVTDINPNIREDAKSAGKNPYTDGWILRLHSEELKNDIKNLYIADQSEKFIDKEVNLLYSTIEKSGNLLNTDGGYLAENIYGNIPQLGWERLTQLFLRT
ncbi:MAG: glycine cleavage system protein H [Proteobacteria bacterium]|nr:glycine cleavage system protein H [Pseudomonadota bacterium]MBU4010009.1 glycine cleavage system protein H [Pseudomonadota bacterium]